MATLGQIFNVSLLLILAGLTWWVPRRVGLIGLLAVHVVVGFGFIGMGAIALATGIWDSYEGGEVIIELLLQAFAFNCLLLPVALFALWRWWKDADDPTLERKRAAPRGFEVM